MTRKKTLDYYRHIWSAKEGSFRCLRRGCNATKPRAQRDAVCGGYANQELDRRPTKKTIRNKPKRRKLRLAKFLSRPIKGWKPPAPSLANSRKQRSHRHSRLDWSKGEARDPRETKNMTGSKAT